MISTRRNEAFLFLFCWNLKSQILDIRWSSIIFVAVAALLLMGCRSESVSVEPGAQTKPTVEMRQVTDDLGRTITVPVKITRAVSLAPNLTESIFAVGAGDRLVGVTTFCNYPEEAKSIAKIGDTMNPNMESIVALRPDVVFVSTASQIESFMKTLEANGIAVYVTNPNDLSEILKNLKELGDLFGTQEQARALISDLEMRLIPLLRTGPGIPKIPHVFIQISREPLFSIGKQSFITEIVHIVGGESVTQNIDSAYPKVSKETALALRPDAIILSDSEDNKEPNEVFKNSPAVKNGQVYSINADLLSRPGPRIFDAMEQIAKNLHPEKFE